VAEFIQTIEFQTSKIDEVRQLAETYNAEAQASSTAPGTVHVTADRDKPNSYITIAKFTSYEQAMENSNSAATSAFAQKMMELCDGPPTFRNLDVVSTY
jgi:quinol monooxygenase YgiN